MSDNRILVWDLPTRVTHWVLALAVIGAILSGMAGGNLMEWHGRLGVLIIGVLTFRIVWGFVGSTYARFGSFLPTRPKILRYLRGEWQAEGHNPLGALSVFLILGVVAVQALTGLIANDDIAFAGPLRDLVSSDMSDQMTALHEFMSKLVMASIGLHICAIAYYKVWKKKNLVKPMIVGWKDGKAEHSAKGGGIVAVLLAIFMAMAAFYGASGVWVPKPVPAVKVETPSW